MEPSQDHRASNQLLPEGSSAGRRREEEVQFDWSLLNSQSSAPDQAPLDLSYSIYQYYAPDLYAHQPLPYFVPVSQSSTIPVQQPPPPPWLFPMPINSNAGAPSMKFDPPVQDAFSYPQPVAGTTSSVVSPPQESPTGRICMYCGRTHTRPVRYQACQNRFLGLRPFPCDGGCGRIRCPVQYGIVPQQRKAETALPPRGGNPRAMQTMWTPGLASEREPA
ncbi:SubName: Full=Uncharacterized protein {ECO:0000313/EMBL:CCA74411.1} [Serendipita indica DSM 11827]|nr:SubName: Full=Uncharacterized protein {ECO:0000313/EMBL:CCA74411.1} [Serendipita indica DSM 11827]